MRPSFFTLSTAALALLFFAAGTAEAKSNFLDDFNAEYGTGNTRLDDCDTCHVPGSKNLNGYGSDWSAANGSFLAIEGVDSDGDGYLNGEEIAALTFPGDGSDYPADPGPTCTDEDLDGYAIEGGSSCGPTDCDDTDPDVNPGTTEICTDGIDNDCDALVDAQDPSAVGCPPDCIDLDEDGYFVNGDTCGPVDCDDTDPFVNPGAVEICDDGIDQDCSGADAVCTPPDCPDEDGDGFLAAWCGGTDCNDSDANIYPGAVDLCRDGIDQDCNGKDRTKGKGCPKDPRSPKEGKGGTCSDRADNDGDGLIDCGDPDCANQKKCR